MVNTNEPIIISLGGSLVIPDSGIDVKFLTEFNRFIRKKVAQDCRFFIVVGGGKTARRYIDAASAVTGSVSKNDLDWLGVHTTRLNAHLLRTIFQDIAHPRIIENYSKKISGDLYPVVVAAGWKPGWSTDYDAVLLARDYGASTLLNLSNIEYVYDKDPAKHKDAKRIERTTWEHFSKLVGSEWDPGLNAPFDPIATNLAKKIGLTVVIMKGNDFQNLDDAISGRKFKGTIVMPFKMDASFYDRDYFEEGKGYSGYTTSLPQRLRFKLVNFYRAASIVLSLHPKSFLDVGCATGFMVRYLRKMKVDAKGLEISHYALSRAEDRVREFLQLGDILKIPYKDNSFDVVSSFDVLQHVSSEAIPQALAECNRVAKKYTVHKVFTTENAWIRRFHGQDLSHISVYGELWWRDLFQDLGYTLAHAYYPRLPGFMETIFVLEKKTSSDHAVQ